MDGDIEEQLDASLAEIDKAIREYTKVLAKRNGHETEPYVMAWVGYSEYLLVGQENANSSYGVPIYPSDQLGSTTRGLFHFGADRKTSVIINHQNNKD